MDMLRLIARRAMMYLGYKTHRIDPIISSATDGELKVIIDDAVYAGFNRNLAESLILDEIEPHPQGDTHNVRNHKGPKSRQ